MQKGFTLIEIIIVIIIMTVILGAATASYQGSSQEKRLQSDATKVADIVRVARDKTVNREIPTSVGNCTTFDGYRVNFTMPNRYSLRLFCDGVMRQESRYVFTYAEISELPVADLVFTYPLARTSGVFTVFLKNTSINRCKLVTIDLNGNTTIADSEAC
jgi:prepilin-type N-terminal cleavage/methylation domain-containing protein